MRRIVSSVLICCLVCLLAGCSPQVQRTVFAMDTVMDLQLWGEDAEEAADQVQTLLQSLEKKWSATAEDSVIGQLNRGKDVLLEQTDDAFLQSVLAYGDMTGGAFDPMLGNVSRAWGFYGQQYRVPTDAQIARALEDKRWDLGGVIKGYAGQQAAQLLANMQIDRAVMSLGGNIQTYGQKQDGTPWIIGIQNPAGGDPIGTVSVTGTAAVVTSGDYQRFFEEDGIRYHHILDPKTGKPARSGLSSVTVICRDGTGADVLSTALFVMGLTDAIELWEERDDFEAVFITEAGDVYATEGAAFSGCGHEVIERAN